MSDDDLDEDEGGPAFPVGVRVAGWIWLLCAAVWWLGAIASTALREPVSACGFLGCAAVAAGFLQAGLLTTGGDARDTLANGIGSVGVSLIFLGLTAVAAVAALNRPPGPGLAGFVVLGAIGAHGSLLMVAGVLALTGRSQYKAWRAAQYPPPEEPPATTDDGDTGDEPPPS